jgi:hypothetical protein
MIKNIIYVEDGSVDVDKLEADLTEETLIIIYRQGSICPKIEQLDEPLTSATDEKLMKSPKSL